MPVWHESTKDLRANEELVVIGITQEQHADRCRLYAQWQGIDWPILWDPFNLTETKAVPVITAVDEFGVVRSQRPLAESLVEDFLIQVYEPPSEGEDPHPAVTRALLESDAGEGADPDATPWALARLLWPTGADRVDIDRALDVLQAAALEKGADPRVMFRLGVAQRLRYDSPWGRPEDLAACLESWTRALRQDASQYIWRRRIQQYGPRLDKPYPFYDWIETAREELIARGESPHPVQVALSGAEVAEGSRELAWKASEAKPPDPKGVLPRDKEGLVRIDVAAAPHTPGKRAQPVSRVHLVLRPSQSQDVHWANEAGPGQVWIDLPEGWSAESRTFELPTHEEASSAETRVLDFEVVRGETEEDSDDTLRGYAVYFVCQGESGACSFLRQDFELSLPTDL